MIRKQLDAVANFDEWSAMHEAAHAAVARHYGLAVYECDMNHIKCDMRVASGRDLADPRLRGVLTMWMAGEEACQMFCGLWETGGWDLVNARRYLVTRYGTSDGVATDVLDAAQRRAACLMMTDFAEGLGRVAAALLRYRSLTQLQIDLAMAIRSSKSVRKTSVVVARAL